jgi:hypothetical protein
MSSSDSLLSRLMPVLLILAVAVGGWWMFLRPHPAAVEPQQGPGVLDGPSSANPYLLQPSQIGPEYDQVAAETRATTSTEIRRGESAAGLATIRSSWKDGARAGWYQVHGSLAVTSRAEVFSTSNLSAVSSSLRTQMLHLYHGHIASAPAALPGSGGWFITGHTISPIISPYPFRRQVAVYGWQHGDVLAIIIVSGLGHDDVPKAAATLATAQDANIKFVSAG